MEKKTSSNRKPLRILLDDKDRARLDTAARAQRLPTSAWARAILLKAAAVGSIVLAVGCGRAPLVADSTDGAVVADAAARDLAPTEDLAQRQDMTLCQSAAECDCVNAVGAECFAMPGTQGCAMDMCRGRLALGPCVAGSPSDCAYAYGTMGCPPNECRAELRPDLWSAGCAAADAGGIADGACP